MHCQVMKGQGTKVYEQVNALSSDERSRNQGLRTSECNCQVMKGQGRKVHKQMNALSNDGMSMNQG